jgi:murein DD-endopeptidase MepM/ murein hydrolase activator NlpD
MGIVISGKRTAWWRNKAVLAAIFICAASFVNAASGGLEESGSASLPSSGGPAEPSFAEVGAGEDAVTAFPAPPITFHDALAEEPGQSYGTGLPEEDAAAFAGRMMLPARGINWGESHPHNAVDVAGRCGSPLYASAPGQAVTVREGWGGGYGNYADIDHGNGVITRYAHAAEITVEVGQMVASGDEIGTMGTTGNSSGCHVHFELLGAAGVPNPFVKK